MKRRRSQADVIDLAPPSIAPPIAQTRIGRLVSWDAEAGATVDYPGNPHGPLPARSVLPLDEATVRSIREHDVALVLTFESARSDLPIVLGVVHTGPSPARPEAPRPLEAVVDGRRVRLQAEDEIELRCGKASIVLRRNGRVVIRGAFVETRSSGLQRIRGGSVRIN